MKSKVKTGNWTIQKTSETKRLTFTSDKDGTQTYQGNAPSYVNDAEIVQFILARLADVGDRITLSNGTVFNYGSIQKTQRN